MRDFSTPTRFLLSGLLICLAGTFATPALSQTATEPQAEALPSWLKISGVARVRYETLDDQFRAGGTGGDQAIAFRTLVLAEANLAPVNLPAVTLGFELQDSRMELDDAGTPLGPGLVNTLDSLQAFARFDLDGTFGQSDASLILGRQTLAIGSQRVLERAEMGNVIRSYTGAHWRSSSSAGDEWHILLVAPVGRRPTDRDSLEGNEVQPDREEWGRHLWGIHHRHKDAFGPALPDVWLEGFVYGLHERDTARVPTPNRDYLQPGFRVFRAPKAGRSDFDVETSWRTGSRRATALASDTRDLDVNAWTIHAHWGWTFESDWNWRVALDFDYASGDENPTDSRFDQYERLFGSRRTDLGNSGIFGALSPVNLNAPGARVEFAPNARTDVRIAWKAASLASDTDLWTDGRLRDQTGQSGSFIGHSINARARYWLVPDRLRGEAGFSTLLTGEFARNAPNSPRVDRTVFGFVQLSLGF